MPPYPTCGDVLDLTAPTVATRALSGRIETRTMRRRRDLRIAGVAAAGTLAGCSAGGSTGTLVAEASDQPGDIRDFETLVRRVSRTAR